MPIINLTIQAYGKNKTIPVDTSRNLLDYKTEIDSAIDLMSPTSDLSPNYDLFYQSQRLDMTKTLDSVGVSENISIDAEAEIQDDEMEIEDESGVKFLQAIPEKDLFRILIDDQRQDFDEKSIQDRTKALVSTIDFIQNNEELTVPFFKNIHKICAGENKSVKSGKFFTNTHAFGFTYQSLSVKGLQELSHFAKKYSSNGIEPMFGSSLINNKMTGFYHSLSNINPFRLYSELVLNYQTSRLKKEDLPVVFEYNMTHTKEQCEQIVSLIFHNYNNKITEASDDNSKLKATIDCSFDLIHLHPFLDFNSRTCLILFNALLMQNGFPPSSYFQFGVSKDEFFNITKQGMLKTISLIEKSETSSISYEDIMSAKLRIQSLQNFPNPNWMLFDNKIKKGLLELELPESQSSLKEKKKEKVQPKNLEMKLITAIDSIDLTAPVSLVDRNTLTRLVQQGARFDRVAPQYAATPLQYLDSLKNSLSTENYQTIYQLIVPKPTPVSYTLASPRFMVKPDDNKLQEAAERVENRKENNDNCHIM